MVLTAITVTFLRDNNVNSGPGFVTKANVGLVEKLFAGDAPLIHLKGSFQKELFFSSRHHLCDG